MSAENMFRHLDADPHNAAAVPACTVNSMDQQPHVIPGDQHRCRQPMFDMRAEFTAHAMLVALAQSECHNVIGNDAPCALIEYFTGTGIVSTDMDLIDEVALQFDMTPAAAIDRLAKIDFTAAHALLSRRFTGAKAIAGKEASARAPSPATARNARAKLRP